MLEMCEHPPKRLCPFCGEVYEDNAEYIDVGAGSIQVTGNYCENPECGAVEQGCYVYDGDEWEHANGWVRHKYESPAGLHKRLADFEADVEAMCKNPDDWEFWKEDDL